MRRTVVVGVGNRWRRDDGAGPVVADAVRRRAATLPAPCRDALEVVEVDGEAARLVEEWAGADLAVVVDAVRTGAAPGTVHRLDAFDLGAAPAAVSSHGLGVADAMALGQAVSRLPHRLVVIGVEGAEFGDGPGLTPNVAACIDGAAGTVLEIVGGAG